MAEATGAAAGGDKPVAWLDEQAIRDAARDVIAGPDYDLQEATTPPSGEWMIEWLEWLLTPLRWVFEMMEGTPDWLRWPLIIVLCLLLLLLVVHIVWSLTAAISPPRIGKLSLASNRTTVIDPEQLEAESRSLAAARDYVGACRRLLRASIATLQTIRKRRFRPGITNHELLREYAATPVAGPLRQLVRTIDNKWYGDEPCLEADYEACSASHAQIRQVVRERTDAVGA